MPTCSTTETASAEPLSILLVDDEDAVRQVVAWMLEDAGHAVHEATNGQSALDFLDGHGPVDLVITDINMPVLDGVEFATRARRRWPGLPVLLVSGRPPPGGAKPFIPKPFRWEALAEAISRMMSPRRMSPEAPC